MDGNGCEDITRKPSIGRQDVQKAIKEMRPIIAAARQPSGGQPPVHSALGPAATPTHPGPDGMSNPEPQPMAQQPAYTDYIHSLIEAPLPEVSAALQQPAAGRTSTPPSPSAMAAPVLNYLPTIYPQPSPPVSLHAAAPRTVAADASGQTHYLTAPAPAAAAAVAAPMNSGLDPSGSSRRPPRHRHATSTASSVFDDSDSSSDEKKLARRSARMHPRLVVPTAPQLPPPLSLPPPPPTTTTSVPAPGPSLPPTFQTVAAVSMPTASSIEDASRRLAALVPSYRPITAAGGPLTTAPSDASSVMTSTTTAATAAAAAHENTLLLLQHLQVLLQQQQQPGLLGHAGALTGISTPATAHPQLQPQQTSTSVAADKAASMTAAPNSNTVAVAVVPGPALQPLLLGSANSPSNAVIESLVNPAAPPQHHHQQILVERYLNQWSQISPMVAFPGMASPSGAEQESQAVQTYAGGGGGGGGYCGVSPLSPGSAAAATAAPSSPFTTKTTTTTAAAVAGPSAHAHAAPIPLATAPVRAPMSMQELPASARATTAATALMAAGGGGAARPPLPPPSQRTSLDAIAGTATATATATAVPHSTGFMLPLGALGGPVMPPPVVPVSEVMVSGPLEVPTIIDPAAALPAAAGWGLQAQPVSAAPMVTVQPPSSSPSSPPALQQLQAVPTPRSPQRQAGARGGVVEGALTARGGGGYDGAEGGQAAAAETGGAPGLARDSKKGALPSDELVAENLAGNIDAIAIFEQDEEEEDVEAEEEVPSPWYHRPAVLWFLCSGGLGAALLVVGIILHAKYRNTYDAFRWCYFFAAMPLLYYILSYASRHVFALLEWWFFRESLLYLLNVQRSALWLLFFLALLPWYQTVFRWAWCENTKALPRRCQQPAYVKATQIVWNVLLCLMLFCLANLLKAVLAKLLTTHFYRTAHFKKLRRALEKEFALQVLSRPRRSVLAERPTTQLEVGTEDGHHGAWYHLTSYLHHHHLHLGGGPGDAGENKAAAAAGGGGGGSGSGTPADKNLAPASPAAAAGNFALPVNVGRGGFALPLGSAIPEEIEEAGYELDHKQTADGGGGGAGAAATLCDSVAASGVIGGVNDHPALRPTQPQSLPGMITGTDAAPSTYGVHVSSCMVAGTAAAAAAPLSPAELPLGSPSLSCVSSPGAAGSPQPQPQLQLQQPNQTLQMPALVDSHVTQPGANVVITTTMTASSGGGSGAVLATGGNSRLGRVGSGGGGGGSGGSVTGGWGMHDAISAPGPMLLQQQQQQQQPSAGPGVDSLAGPAAVAPLRKDSRGSRASKASVVKPPGRALTGALGDAAGRARKSSEAITQVMATAMAMSGQTKTEAQPSANILRGSAKQGLRRLSDVELEKVRTAIVIKTQSALILKYTDRSDEDMAKELGRVKRFAKALFYNVLPTESGRDYLIAEDFVPFFVSADGAGSSGGAAAAAPATVSSEGRKLTSVSSMRNDGAVHQGKDGAPANTGSGGGGGDGGGGGNAKGLGRISFALAADPGRTARLRARQRAAEEAAKKAFAVFDSDNNGEVSRSEVKEAVVNIYNERRNMARSLKDTDTIVQSLEFGIGGVIHFVFAAVYLLIWGVDLLTGFSTFSATVLALTFVFGNSVKNMYESMLFLFVTHPYDVGDCILIGADMYRVKKISLLYTDMIKFNGERMYMPNTSLISQGIINWTRSKTKSESCRLVCDIGVAWEVREDIQAALRSYAKEHPGEFDGEPSCNFRELADPLKVVLACSWTYNFAPDDFSRLSPARNGMLYIVQSKVREHRLMHTTFMENAGTMV